MSSAIPIDVNGRRMYVAFAVGGALIESGRVPDELVDRIERLVGRAQAGGALDVTRGPLSLSIGNMTARNLKGAGVSVEQKVDGVWKSAVGPRLSKKKRERATKGINQQIFQAVGAFGQDLLEAREEQKDGEERRASSRSRGRTGAVLEARPATRYRTYSEDLDDTGAGVGPGSDSGYGSGIEVDSDSDE